MNRKLKILKLKSDYLKLELEDVKDDFKRFNKDFDKYFDKYYEESTKLKIEDIIKIINSKKEN